MSQTSPQLDFIQLRGIADRINKAVEQCARNFYHLALLSGLTKSRGFAWPQVLCPSPVGIFLVVSRCDAFERKCDKSLGVEVQIVRQPARRADGLAIPWPDGLRFADSRNRL